MAMPSAPRSERRAWFGGPLSAGAAIALALLGSGIAGADARPDPKRAHHVLYAHEVMREEFFSNPAGMLDTLEKNMGDTFLFFVWQKLGKTLKHPLKHSDIGTLPGSTKKAVITLSIVGIDRKEGWTWAVIRMPPTEGPGESVYLIMVQRPGRARYFTLDRTKKPKRGALVEWFKDGKSKLVGHSGYDVGKVLDAVSAALAKSKAK